MSLTVALVYPELLGTYGDRGNGVVLAARARWRGIDAELVEVLAGDRLPAADIYCLGGGEDGPELRASESLRADGTLVRAVEHGAPVLAVCGGYQILGRTFPSADGRPLPGLGLLDVATVKGTGRRAVGELLAQPLPALGEQSGATAGGGGGWNAPDRGTRGGAASAGRPRLPLPVLTGFENHGGLTRLGPEAAPLARVVSGVGNGDGTEGALAGRVIGTYLHGPILARNPALADLLLSWATGEELAPLDDAEEEALRRERIAAARRMPRWRASGRSQSETPGSSGTSAAARVIDSPSRAQTDVDQTAGSLAGRAGALLATVRSVCQSKFWGPVRSATRSVTGALARAASPPTDRPGGSART